MILLLRQRSRRPSIVQYIYMYIYVHTVLCLRAGVQGQIGCCAALQFRHRRSSFSNSRRPIFRLSSTPREYLSLYRMRLDPFGDYIQVDAIRVQDEQP